jgi:hypothetical protein
MESPLTRKERGVELTRRPPFVVTSQRDLNGPVDIALITSRWLPKGWSPLAEEAALNLAFGRLRYRTRLIAWDADDIDWGEIPAALVVSPWDDWMNPRGFLDRMRHVESQGTRLLNSVEFMELVISKRRTYEVLKAAGVPMLPTWFIGNVEEVGGRAEWMTWLRERRLFSEPIVVKPEIGGGSLEVEPFTINAPDDLDRFLRDVRSITSFNNNEALVTPYYFLSRDPSAPEELRERDLVICRQHVDAPPMQLTAFSKSGILSLEGGDERQFHPNRRVYQPTPDEQALVLKAEAALTARLSGPPPMNLRGDEVGPRHVGFQDWEGNHPQYPLFGPTGIELEGLACLKDLSITRPSVALTFASCVVSFARSLGADLREVDPRLLAHTQPPSLGGLSMAMR